MVSPPRHTFRSGPLSFRDAWWHVKSDFQQCMLLWRGVYSGVPARAGRAERHCICELDPRYRLAPRIVHAWTHNCSIWSRSSWQLLHSGFGRSGACVSTRLPYVCVSRYSKCVCVCVDTLACVFRRKGTKGRARSLNVRFPAVTPRLVLQWPCLPLCESVCVSVCVCVCGGGVRLLSHSLVFSRFSELCGVNAEITCWVMSDGPNYRLNNE